MSHHHGIFRKFQKFWENLFNGFRIHHHTVIDAGKLLYFKRNRHLRIDKYRKSIFNLSLFHPNRTNFNNPVRYRTEACGLNIKNHIGLIQTLSLTSGYHSFQIIYQIRFHTINNLKRRIHLFQFVLSSFRMLFLVILSVITDDVIIGVICFRKGLHNSVICNGNCRMSPFVCSLYKHTGIRNPIHITHLRMTVKFHSFLRTVVHSTGSKISYFLNTRQ